MTKHILDFNTGSTPRLHTLICIPKSFFIPKLMFYLRGWNALCMGLANQLIMSLVVLLICVNNYCKILKEENSSVVVCNVCLVICFDHTVIKRFNITTYKQPFVTRLTRRVPLVEKELLTLPGHLSSTPGF
jgi:hypothetical protein